MILLIVIIQSQEKRVGVSCQKFLEDPVSAGETLAATTLDSILKKAVNTMKEKQPEKRN